jgi:integrase
VHRDPLVLPNRKNPSRPTKRVYLPAGHQDLPGELLVWAREQRIPDDGWLFPGRFPGRPLSRMQAWSIVREASERAGVQVLALRASQHGQRGEPAPIHPHLFRHARVRQIVRSTRNLPLAQRQAGWSRLQMAYLTVGDEEARQLMRELTE